MREVVLFGSGPRRPGIVAEAVASFRSLGATSVILVTLSQTDDFNECGLDEVHSLLTAAVGYPPEFWRSTAVARQGVRMWRHVELDNWVLRRAARAEALVALDGGAVYTVWSLAQWNPVAAARHGVHPALRAFAEASNEASDPAISWTGPLLAPSVEEHESVTVAEAEPTRIRRLVRRLVGRADETPAQPEGSRLDRCVQEVIDLNDAGRRTEAAQLSKEYAGAFNGARKRADLFGRIAAHELAAGRPVPDLATTYAAELAYADRLFARGQIRQAVSSYLQATRLAFYPGIHFDSLNSPLSEKPAEFVAPLHTSAVTHALTTPQGRSQPPAEPPPDRPLRLLIVTNGNDNFTRDLTEFVETDLHGEVRLLTAADLDHLGYFRRDGFHRLLMKVASGDTDCRDAIEEALRPHIDWADVVLLEWCTRMSYLFTLVDPGTSRVIMRLHSYEAWTVWPHLVDYSRIDRTVFVSDHLRDFVEQEVPQLTGPEAPDVRVVPNAVALQGFAKPKRQDARFTLGMIGYAGVAKDLRWTLSLLRSLRQVDSRYRLRLVGHPMSNRGTPAFLAYRDACQSELDQLVAERAVEIYGPTDDVPTALEEVGVIVSSSVRESAHLAVMEGAASGAVPLIRDWPFFAHFEHGPRTLYPEDWVVNDITQASSRVLDVTRTEGEWESHSRDAREIALSRYDLSATGNAYKDLLGP